jgi:hypothetical protein
MTAKSKDVRQGSLPPGVSVKVVETRWSWTDSCSVYLTYRGTIAALLAAGCLTPQMMANRQRQHSRREQCDEHGNRFNLHRSPTKALPERMKLERHGEPTFVMQLPGVRELFPEGIAKFVQAEAQSSEPATDCICLATSRAWKDEQIWDIGSYLRTDRLSRHGDPWRGAGIYGPRFRFADADIKHMESMMDRFREEMCAALEQAAVIDSEQSPRPSFLRLVVNNEFAGGCTP